MLPEVKTEVPTFDYSTVNPDTAEFLKKKECTIEGIFHKARFEVGRELKEAQELLAKNRYGCFIEWAESIGFKKQTTYNLINYHNLIVQQLDSKDIIEELPKRLAYDISSPSAPPELKQAVLNGDITTHKEYQELKRQLELEQAAKADAEQRVNNLANQLSSTTEENQRLREENLELANKPPEVEVQKIMKGVEI